MIKIKPPGKSIVFKSIIGTIIPLLLYSFVIAIVGYFAISHSLMLLYETGAMQIAHTAENYVDGERIDEYAASGGETPEYLEVWQELDKLCNTSGSAFIYVIRPDLTDYAHIVFLFSTINHNVNYTVYDYGYVRETTNQEYRDKYRALYEGGSDGEIVIRDKGVIETDAHITAMIPIRDSEGKTQAILCVQRQIEAVAAIRSLFLQIILITLVVFAVIVIILLSLHIRRILLKPLQKITKEASRFATEETGLGEKLRDSIKNEDEIGILAESIDQMEERIAMYVEDLTRVAAEKERIRTELSLATRIQANMLPNTFPAFPERTDFDVYASMNPAKDVGGDFYDFFLIDEDHLCAFIADVSGKGVPAALFMMSSKIILSNNVKKGQSPAKILENTNNAICANNREEMFVTVWIGILELSTGKLVTANAGHEYPALKKPGGCFELVKEKHGVVIGGIENIRYKESEFLLEPGSILFLYTDGVSEATNAANQLFGSERLLDVLNSNSDAELPEILNQVAKGIDAFVDGAEQFDDITLMCIEYK